MVITIHVGANRHEVRGKGQMKAYIKILLNVIIYFLSGISIRKKNRIIFGAWSGMKYGDNSKYIYEYILKHYSDYELIWVGCEKLRDQVPTNSTSRFIEKSSLKAYYYALTSKYVFFTNGYLDITKRFNVLRNSVITQLWHGGGIKRILADSVEAKWEKKEISTPQWLNYNVGRRSYNKCQYFITSSEEREKNILSAFRYFGINSSHDIIKHGQPRNDFLINNNDSEYIHNIKKKISEKYNIPQDKKVVLYLPTYRDKTKINFSFSQCMESQGNAFESLLEANNAIIIEKAHSKDMNNENNKMNKNSKYVYNLNNVSNEIDTQELMLVSDILITDYSGCYLDFLLLNRPIIHFGYDYEEYKNNDRGFKYDLKDVAGGVFVDNKKDLIAELKLHLEDSTRYKQRRDQINKLMNSYEKGQSCMYITESVLGKY